MIKEKINIGNTVRAGRLVLLVFLVYIHNWRLEGGIYVCEGLKSERGILPWGPSVSNVPSLCNASSFSSLSLPFRRSNFFLVRCTCARSLRPKLRHSCYPLSQAPWSFTRQIFYSWASNNTPSSSIYITLFSLLLALRWIKKMWKKKKRI